MEECQVPCDDMNWLKLVNWNAEAEILSSLSLVYLGSVPVFLGHRAYDRMCVSFTQQAQADWLNRWAGHEHLYRGI